MLPFEGDRKVYRERLEHELGVIKTMGFPGYFLIVADLHQLRHRQRDSGRTGAGQLGRAASSPMA